MEKATYKAKFKGKKELIKANGKLIRVQGDNQGIQCQCQATYVKGAE